MPYGGDGVAGRRHRGPDWKPVVPAIFLRNWRTRARPTRSGRDRGAVAGGSQLRGSSQCPELALRAVGQIAADVKCVDEVRSCGNKQHVALLARNLGGLGEQRLRQDRAAERQLVAKSK